MYREARSIGFVEARVEGAGGSRVIAVTIEAIASCAMELGVGRESEFTFGDGLGSTF